MLLNYTRFTADNIIVITFCLLFSTRTVLMRRQFFLGGFWDPAHISTGWRTECYIAEFGVISFVFGQDKEKNPCSSHAGEQCTGAGTEPRVFSLPCPKTIYLPFYGFYVFWYKKLNKNEPNCGKNVNVSL